MVLCVFSVWGLGGCFTADQDRPLIRSSSDYNRLLIQAQQLAEAPLTLFERGERLGPDDQQRLRDASAKVSELIEFAPDRMGPFILQAKIHNALGELDDAREFYRLAIEQTPANPNAEEQVALGSVYYDLALMEFEGAPFVATEDEVTEAYEAARNYAQQALLQHPNNARYLGLMASILLQLKQYESAREFARNALSIDSRESRARGVLALLATLEE